MADSTGHETEVKLRLESVESLRRAGIALTLVRARHFEDNWLLDTEKLALGHDYSVLRVRETAGEGLLTFKAPPSSDEAASQFKKRVEIETRIEDPAQMIAILERLGFQKWFRYQKYRTVYRATLPGPGLLQVMFDETPIGNFVELEGDEGAIFHAVALMGLTPADYILESYLGLQLAHCRARGATLTDLVFEGG